MRSRPRSPPGSGGRSPGGYWAAAILAASTLIQAQPAGAQAQPAAIAFDLPAQDLNRALLALSRRAGLQIFYDVAKVDGLTAPEVRGRMPVGDALDRLLAGTGLSYRFVGRDAVALDGRPAPDAPGVAGDAEMLDTIVVEAERPGSGYGATTAVRAPMAPADSPQTEAVVTRQVIRDRAMTSLADALRVMPGTGVAQGEGNRDTSILRGYSSTADFFVDGLRDDVEYYRDLYNVERVESLAGPHAVFFGRGGTGGVINRVTRRADGTEVATLDLQAGSWGERRATVDAGTALAGAAAVRVIGLHEESEGFREAFRLKRQGINPTVTLGLDRPTSIAFGYEHFRDERTADRGVPSFEGAPLAVDIATFFGDPDQSVSTLALDSLTLDLGHDFGGGLRLESRNRYAVYDKSFRNVFPRAVDPAGTMVAIAAYSGATRRENLFSQTELGFSLEGDVTHDIVAGIEFGRQRTDNRRETGFFDSIAYGQPSVMVPVDDPRSRLPITFRPGPTDPVNGGTAVTRALYVQDRIGITDDLFAVVGLRYEVFSLDFEDRRDGRWLSADDEFLSPRLSLAYKPAAAWTLYATYSRSYLPRAGSQLASLTLRNEALAPERATNYELGAKWQIAPDLLGTAAVYRTERSNVEAVDPADPARSLLVDGQRTLGAEVSLSGSIAPGLAVTASYAYQDARIESDHLPVSIRPAPVLAGARVGQVPRHSASLWARYDFDETWGMALGLSYRDGMYTSNSNQVALPGFLRTDAALYLALDDAVRAQVNVENVFDVRYYTAAHGDNNIMPGAPRSLRFGVTVDF
ncbi:TonB-dependent siderophore receptor [Zavarzinia compransoris]|uniref:TonB-dependent siderophore receptor n=1 Tax=Zavarzinia compransoris TaxID=1264899 RepID=A0A317E3Q7_9PROT|nr:TonB-dependent siderophore receptor [Zavarzinia compransoris]PWR21667.1 TonB-dependent siderophore receptor [Zavarzinia compransoris]TDP45551.1 catecholate siderophore receptor [Zavarzinia compransoris]